MKQNKIIVTAILIMILILLPSCKKKETKNNLTNFPNPNLISTENDEIIVPPTIQTEYSADNNEPEEPLPVVIDIDGPEIEYWESRLIKNDILDSENVMTEENTPALKRLDLHGGNGNYLVKINDGNGNIIDKNIISLDNGVLTDINEEYALHLKRKNKAYTEKELQSNINTILGYLDSDSFKDDSVSVIWNNDMLNDSRAIGKCVAIVGLTVDNIDRSNGSEVYTCHNPLEDYDDEVNGIFTVIHYPKWDRINASEGNTFNVCGIFAGYKKTGKVNEYIFITTPNYLDQILWGYLDPLDEEEFVSKLNLHGYIGFDEESYMEDGFVDDHAPEDIPDGCLDSRGNLIRKTDNVVYRTFGLNFHGIVEDINGTQINVRWISILDSLDRPVDARTEQYNSALYGFEINKCNWIEGTDVDIESSSY